MEQGSTRGRKPVGSAPRRVVTRQDSPRSMGRALGHTSVASTRGQRGRPSQRSVVVSEPPAEAGPSMFRSETSFLGGQNQFDNHRGDRTNVTVHIHKSGTVDASLDPEMPDPRTFPSSQEVRNIPTSLAHRPDGNTGSPTNLPRQPQRSNKLYESHLMQKGRGYPLWIPQANLELPVPYRAVGPSIGDVGLITQFGAFDFLFNVCRPRDDPINPEDLPENFAPIDPPLKPAEIRKFREFNSGSYLASSSIAMSQLESQTPELIFESSAADGAILTMPEGAHQEELRNVEKFRDYIATHAEDWYRFVNRTLGCEAQNGDLHLVVGSDKSTSWGMATFVNVSQQRNFRLKFHVLGVENRTSPGCMSVWEHSGMAEVRSGPDVGENDELGATPDHPLRNQCLFVRTLNISLPDDAWKRANQKLIPVSDDASTKKPTDVKGDTTSTSISGAGRGEGVAPSGQGSRENTGSGGNPVQDVLLADIFPSPTTIHPSKVINNFLLKQKPEAVVAITHDRDWYNLVNAEDEAFPNSSTLLDRISAANDVCLNNGVAYLQLKGPNKQDRDREQQELLNLAQDFKTHQMTLERYLFGDSAAYTTQLSKFVKEFTTTIASPSHVHDCLEGDAPSIPPCLIADRRRFLLLDDLISLLCGSKHVSELTEDPISTHSALFSDASDGNSTGSMRARIAFGLHRRYVRLKQIDDLEEAIVIYHNLLTLGCKPYLHLEALLGLAPLLHQRYLIKKSPEDLHSLVQNLQVQASLSFGVILHPVQQAIDSAFSLSSKDSPSLSGSQLAKKKSAPPNFSRNLDQKKHSLSSGTLSDDISRPPPYSVRPIDHLVTTLSSTQRALAGVKVNKSQCQFLVQQYLDAVLMVQESSPSMNNSASFEFLDELEALVDRLERKSNTWASYNRLMSLIRRQDIKDDINVLRQDMMATVQKFSISQHIEITKQVETLANVIENDRLDLRKLLESIIQSTADIKATLQMQGSLDKEPIDELMECIQTELADPTISVDQKKTLSAGLWVLHEESSKLPVSADLTGQIMLDSPAPVSANTRYVVYKGRWLDKEPVTLRVLKFLLNKEAQSQSCKDYQKMLSDWRSLQHPNVVPLYGYVSMDLKLYSVGPYMDNGTTTSYLKCFPTADRLKLLAEVASGLEYLHHEQIIHGNLRCDSIMVSKDGVAALIDFGLFKFLGDGDDVTLAGRDSSVRWYAPELIQEQAILSTSSDVWSFAMTSLEVFTGTPPFRDIAGDIQVLWQLGIGKTPERPGSSLATGLSDHIWGLMQACWVRSPDSRPSMADIRESLSGIYTSTKPERTKSTAPSLSDTVVPPPVFDKLINRAWRALLASKTHRVNQRSSYRFSTSSSTVVASDGSPSHLPPSPYLFAEAAPTVEGPSLLTYYSTRSAIQPSLLQEAVTNPLPILHFDSFGRVLSGTLEGLVDHLILKFTLTGDFGAVLLTACVDFSTPEDLFSVISRRFYEIEQDAMMTTELRVSTQFNVFEVIKFWISSQEHSVETSLLWQMKQFCEAAVETKVSPTMKDKGKAMLDLIKENARLNEDIQPASSRTFDKIRLGSSDIKPSDLAIALTLMEGDNFKVLVPADCLTHLVDHQGLNNVDEMLRIKRKFILWVQESILHGDSAERRAEVLCFFINAAGECRRLNNLSSYGAIVTALVSRPVKQLKLTKSQLSSSARRKMESLEGIIDPSHNYAEYRGALDALVKGGTSVPCIPWLDYHLRSLRHVLAENPNVIVVDDVPCISFERYTKFMDGMKELGNCETPDLERYRDQGQLDYLKRRLDSMKPIETVEEQLIKRSQELALQEAKGPETRLGQLRGLGFQV